MHTFQFRGHTYTTELCREIDGERYRDIPENITDEDGNEVDDADVRAAAKDHFGGWQWGGDDADRAFAAMDREWESTPECEDNFER